MVILHTMSQNRKESGIRMPLDYEQLHACYWCKVRGKFPQNQIQYYIQLTAPRIIGFQNRWACKDCMIDICNKTLAMHWHISKIERICRKTFLWNCSHCYHPFYIYPVQTVAQCPYCGEIEWTIKPYTVTSDCTGVPLKKTDTVSSPPQDWHMTDPKNVLTTWDKFNHLMSPTYYIPQKENYA